MATHIEQLGKAIYEETMRLYKKPITILLKERGLHILDCEESDLEYPDAEETTIKISPTIKTAPIPAEKTVELNDQLGKHRFIMRDGKLYTKNGMECGYYQPWIDDDIPKRYTDDDRVVFHPQTMEPLTEYILHSNKAHLHELSTDMIYRPFVYDDGLDRLIKSGDVKN